MFRGFSHWIPLLDSATNPLMKSCLGIFISLVISFLVVSTGALLWYLSYSAEFARNANPPAATSTLPPTAKPGHPPVNH